MLHAVGGRILVLHFLSTMFNLGSLSDLFSVDFITRESLGDVFHFAPCQDENGTLKASQFCGQTLLGKLEKGCRCRCSLGKFASAQHRVCQRLDVLDNPLEVGSALRASLRYFDPTEPVELELDNCSVEDPSLIHLDRSTPFGWEDFANVDIDSHFLDGIGYSSTVVKIRNHLLLPLPSGSLYRLQFTAPCLTTNGDSSFMRGGFIYFVTTGRLSLISNSGAMSSSDDWLHFSEENHRDNHDDLDELKTGFFNPVTLSAIAVAVVAVVVLVLIVVFCVCKRLLFKNAGVFLERVPNPFKDYVPATDVNHNITPTEKQLDRIQAVVPPRVVPSQPVAAPLRRANLYSTTERTPETSMTPCHDYESLKGFRDREPLPPPPPPPPPPISTVGGEDQLNESVWLNDALPETENGVAQSRFRLSFPSRTRFDYLSWSGINAETPPPIRPIQLPVVEERPLPVITVKSVSRSFADKREDSKRFDSSSRHLPNFIITKFKVEYQRDGTEAEEDRGGTDLTDLNRSRERLNSAAPRMGRASLSYSRLMSSSNAAPASTPSALQTSPLPATAPSLTPIASLTNDNVYYRKELLGYSDNSEQLDTPNIGSRV